MLERVCVCVFAFLSQMWYDGVQNSDPCADAISWLTPIQVTVSTSMYAERENYPPLLTDKHPDNS